VTAPPLVVRSAVRADADAINAVYNPYVRESPATFETVQYDRAAREAWLADYEAGERRLRCFVAQAEGAGPGASILGYANSHRFDPRGAYETSLKVSVFLAPEAMGKGVARALYQALFAALGESDVHRAYALVVVPNPASIRLHRRFGFRQVAVLDEVGRKFGRYWSVVWLQKRF